MDKHIIPPVTVIGAAAAAVFYGLYAFPLIGGNIASSVFLGAGLLLCVLLFLIAASAAGKLPHQSLELRGRKHRVRIRIRRARRFALCITAGAVIGSYSALAKAAAASCNTYCIAGSTDGYCRVNRRACSGRCRLLPHTG